MKIKKQFAELDGLSKQNSFNLIKIWVILDYYTNLICYQVQLIKISSEFGIIFLK